MEAGDEATLSPIQEFNEEPDITHLDQNWVHEFKPEWNIYIISYHNYG